MTTIYKFSVYGSRIAYCKFPERVEDIPNVDRAYYDYPLYPPEDKAINKRPLWRTAVDITLSNDDLYHSFNGTTRANINRARKDGIEIKINTHYAEAAEFAKKFYEAKNIPNRGAIYPAIEVMKQDEHGKKQGILVTAFHNGKMIHGEYFLVGDTRMAPELAFSYRAFDSSYDRLCSEAIRLAYYEGMIYARDMGIKSEINTIGPDINNPSSIGKFKLGFCGKQYLDYNYIKDYNPLLKMANKIGIIRF